MAALWLPIRLHALAGTSAAAFLTAHPPVVTRTPDEVETVMLWRYLGTPVFEDTALLKCIGTQCHTPMDHLGVLAADLCSKRIGLQIRYDAITSVEVLCTHLFKAAGVGVGYKVKYLLLGFNARPAAILVHPPSTPSDPVQSLPVTFDGTVSSAPQLSFLHKAARWLQAVTNAAERRKMCAFPAKVAAIPNDAPTGQSNVWKLVPIAFDPLGTPCSLTNDVTGKFVPVIATRSGGSPGAVRSWLHQKLGFAISSTSASS